MSPCMTHHLVEELEITNKQQKMECLEAASTFQFSSVSWQKFMLTISDLSTEIILLLIN